MRISTKRNIIILFFAVVLAGIILGRQYVVMLRPAVSADYFLRLPTGGGIQNVFDSLESGGAIKDMRTLRRTAAMLRPAYHPGGYKLTRGMNYLTVVRTLQRGLQTPVRVTFNNMRSLEQLSGRLSQQLEPDSAAFAAVLLSGDVARENGFEPHTFIAMFLPDTYEFYWIATPEQFVGRMKREWERFWNDDRRATAAAMGLNPVKVVTLASIVYEETKMSDEMARVAGVYINRLQRGIPLQADPTVKFAIGDFALKRIWERHLKVDSPYNTYKYYGLPPGPVSMPSKRAIDAVLNYETHDYVYFCARPDFSGYHNFARTLEQHNANRRAWQQALNRLQIR